MNHFLKHLGLAEHDLNVIMQISSLEAVKCAVQSCQALAILPTAAIEKELASGHLVTIHTGPAYVRQVKFLFKEQKYPLLIVEELLSMARRTLEVPA
jgi:DNA-binding transcriptional LysR family regulator